MNLPHHRRHDELVCRSEPLGSLTAIGVPKVNGFIVNPAGAPPC
jgi:hypothetical protein